MVRVGINGFGRTGRAVVRSWLNGYFDDVNIVAINSPAEIKTAAHLLKYDTIYRTLHADIRAKGNYLVIDGREVAYSSFKKPEEIPWRSNSIDAVLECCGEFKKRTELEPHLSNGVKKVIVACPCEEADRTIVFGANQHEYDPNDRIISAGSCTSGAVVLAIKVLRDRYGVRKGVFTTDHAYTMDQRLLDGSHDDLARARAATENFILTKSGAQKIVGKIFPELEGKFDGYAIRAPVASVSVANLSLSLGKGTTNDEINEAYKDESEGSLKGLLGYSTENLVSSDYIGDSRSAIIHSLQTKVVDGDLAQVVAWYDNERGHANRLLDLVGFLFK